MTRLKDKAVGTAKEATGEILGDGKLAQEGNEQKKRQRSVIDDETSSVTEPLKRLRDLT